MAADRYDTVTRKLFCRRLFITVGRVRYILRTTTTNRCSRTRGECDAMAAFPPEAQLC